MAIGGKRTLTKGKKKGEMVYTRPDYITGKKRVQVTSGVKGGRGTKNPPRVKPTKSKGQIHSTAIKEKIDKTAKAANKRSAQANKYNPTKKEMFGSSTKRPATFGEIGKRQREEKKSTANTVSEDYGKGKLNVQQIIRGKTPSDKTLRKRNIKLVKPEKIKPVMFEKKHGGKIIYKMTGGQVVDASYD